MLTNQKWLKDATLNMKRACYQSYMLAMGKKVSRKEVRKLSEAELLLFCEKYPRNFWFLC